jgi:hypothetical protein
VAIKNADASVPNRAIAKTLNVGKDTVYRDLGANATPARMDPPTRRLAFGKSGGGGDHPIARLSCYNHPLGVVYPSTYPTYPDPDRPLGGHRRLKDGLFARANPTLPQTPRWPCGASLSLPNVRGRAGKQGQERSPRFPFGKHGQLTRSAGALALPPCSIWLYAEGREDSRLMGLPYSITPYSFAGPSRTVARPPSLHVVVRQLAVRWRRRWQARNNG